MDKKSTNIKYSFGNEIHVHVLRQRYFAAAGATGSSVVVLVISAAKLVKTKKIYIINFHVCLQIWLSMGEKKENQRGKMECTRQRFVYRNICSPNEITWQFHKRHIDLCLQTITTQTIDKCSMWLNENANRVKKKICTRN